MPNLFRGYVSQIVVRFWNRSITIKSEDSLASHFTRTIFQLPIYKPNQMPLVPYASLRPQHACGDTHLYRRSALEVLQHL